MDTEKQLQANIRKAEEIVEDNPDTHPIIHIRASSREVHGYVTEGEPPVACTKHLESRLSKIVRENGMVGGEVPLNNDIGEGPAHAYTEREPGDDGYIDLLNDSLSWFAVLHSENAFDDIF